MSSGQPLTIADMAAAQQVDLKRGSLEVIADEFALSDLLTFQSTNGAMSVRKARINPDDQPPAKYRNINSAGVFVAGSMEAITEHLQIFHAAAQIDKYIMGDSTLLFKPSEQVTFIAKQMGREILNAFINGDPDKAFNTDGSSKPAFQPTGLRYRLQNATQFGIDQDMWTLGITGASIDLSGAITQTVANNLVDSLDEMQRNTMANTCFMSPRMYTVWARSMRLGNFLKTTEDQLGRKWTEILGMRVIVTKIKTATRRIFNTADTTNWIQPWEDVNGNPTPTAGAGSQFNTIFTARVGSGYLEGLTAQGIQQEGPVKLLPPNEGSAYQTSFGYGFFVNTPHDIAGLHGIKLG